MPAPVCRPVVAELRAGAALVVFLACIAPAPAQQPSPPATGAPLQLTPPASRQPGAGGSRMPQFLPSPVAPAQPAPRATAPVPAAPVGTSTRFTALHHEGSSPITRGVAWRVFADESGGNVRLVAESSDAQAQFRLAPGQYLVNAAYGRASLTRRIVVGSTPMQDTFVLNAGGLRLEASVGDRRLPEARVTYEIFTGPGPGGLQVVEQARGGRILRLPVGEYYIVSRFGEANASISGDVRVQAGRLTEVTLHHRAAQVTLKLVNEAGGEARAGTAWSVLTPGGDIVQESIGAFPSMVLAAGEYTVIARNDGRVYTARFRVESGRDRDIEVIAR